MFTGQATGTVRKHTNTSTHHSYSLHEPPLEETDELEALLEEPPDGRRSMATFDLSLALPFVSPALENPPELRAPSFGICPLVYCASAYTFAWRSRSTLASNRANF